jgi:hypothetical protein
VHVQDQKGTTQKQMLGDCLFVQMPVTGWCSMKAGVQWGKPALLEGGKGNDRGGMGQHVPDATAKLRCLHPHSVVAQPTKLISSMSALPMHMSCTYLNCMSSGPKWSTLRSLTMVSMIQSEQ